MICDYEGSDYQSRFWKNGNRSYEDAVERVAEVAARFTLDAMPGKQMAIDADLNAGIPPTWLFTHRWRRGGRCPKTGRPLAYATIGGRTTCWSPTRQKLR